MLRGFSDAIMMRLQLALASGNEGYLPPDHYDQIFTAHGVIMIIFMYGRVINVVHQQHLRLVDVGIMSFGQLIQLKVLTVNVLLFT